MIIKEKHFFLFMCRWSIQKHRQSLSFGILFYPKGTSLHPTGTESTTVADLWRSTHRPPACPHTSATVVRDCDGPVARLRSFVRPPTP